MSERAFPFPIYMYIKAKCLYGLVVGVMFNAK
nr:MAG TPA: hypothetical protein [Caudoviricetes sp.]